MVPVFICPLCKNDDPLYVGFRMGQPYCRRCLSFQGTMDLTPPSVRTMAKLDLSYELTPEQKQLSSSIIDCYHRKQSVVVDAVTGSGKTEIVFGLIQVVLAQKQQVAFIVPRKDVVIELAYRFQHVFPTLRVVALYGGHHEEKQADLWVMTSHQVHRFHQIFDAMIIDETDAFPYEGNPVLHALVQRASKGFFVIMSATFSLEMMDEYSQKGWAVFHLLKRYHHYPLPVPRVIYSFDFFQWLWVVYFLEKWLKQKAPAIIFAPTIALAESLFSILRWLVPKGACVHSQSKQRSKHIESLKEGRLHFLVSTSILERGITLKNLQVLVVQADHPLMDEKTLIQMAGRVGRKRDTPKGEVIYVSQTQSKAMVQSIRRIQEANDTL